MTTLIDRIYDAVKDGGTRSDDAVIKVLFECRRLRQLGRNSGDVSYEIQAERLESAMADALGVER